MSPASHSSVDVLVVGAGRAGLAVVETLVTGAFDGEVLVVGAEPGLPYERPQVSKRLLAGTIERDGMTLPGSTALESTGATRVRHLASRQVLELDPTTCSATLDDGSTVSASHVALASGTRARTLPDLDSGPDVHALRTADDALRLRAAAPPGTTVVVVGAGFIGMEAATSLAAGGGRVVVVDPAEGPMASVLAPHLGELLAGRARDAGVDLRFGTTVADVARDPGGRVRSITTSAGDRLERPQVLVAVGSVPVSPLGEHPAGLVTDACGRTDHPGVLACGDLAAWWWTEAALHARVEHWLTATGQGRAVGATILGTPVAYDEAPFFWSDQFGVRVQSIGHARGDGAWEPHRDAPADAAEFVCATSGRVRAVAAVQRPDLIAAWRSEETARRISRAA